MRPLAVVASLFCLVSCGDTKPAAEAPPTPAAIGASHVDAARRFAIVAEGGCSACHALGEVGELSSLLAPRPGLPLAAAARRLGQRPWRDNACPSWLRDDPEDIAAWVEHLARREPVLEVAEVRQSAFDRGRHLVDELACRACHAPGSLDYLADAIDHAGLTGFLIDPTSRRPQNVHTALDQSAAGAVAAWLLRAQRRDGVVVPGFAYECFELDGDEGELPDLDRLEPAERGVTETLGIDVRTRDNRFALRFSATLDVPQAGEWTFTAGSDDGSWLWIDDRLVVDNAGLKPHKRVAGSIRLDAGPHELRVVYTQGSGGKSLEVLWQGPGTDRQELTAEHASASVVGLVPPVPADGDGPAAEAIERGRAAARAARCDACHAVDDEAFVELSPPAPARAWADLGSGACQRSPTGELRAEVGELPAEPATAATVLALAMLRDGCLSCHVRDGTGGLPPAVQKGLTEVEDLGEEGVLPPDLTAVGRRLRPAWLQRVVAEGHKVRDYVRMRMPAYGEERARRYGKWFAAVDAPDVVDVEPPFSAEAAARGRTLAGTGGRNCITCHSMQGYASLGPQGMDLSIQHERLRPGWFRDWLLRPSELRPGTRMPTLWQRGDDRDLAEIDALRTWLSLGEAAPLPSGIVVDSSSYLLEPVERPILHGAFLKGVSARCLAVGTPERTHFAFDLVEPRLVWLWRGAFLDVRGTWHGRAGQLLEPLGRDWQQLDDFTIEGGTGERRLLGQRRTRDGYPVLRVAAGDVRYEDEVRPRLAANGSEIVRTLRCRKGELVLLFPATDGVSIEIDGAPAVRHVLPAGQSLEVIYRW